MENLSEVLQKMKICRFCFCDDEGELSPITTKRGREGKNSVPLSLQIMACIAIEVFPNDGFPQLICNACRKQTVQSYIFKSNCKKADDALKLFLNTGDLKTPEFERQSKKGVPKTTFSREFKIICSGNGSKNKEITKNVTTSDDGTEVITLSIGQSSPDNEDKEIEDNVVDMESEGNQFEIINMDDEAKQVHTVYPCPHCQKTYPVKQLLEMHLPSHNKDKLYKCSVCEKGFYNQCDLRTHGVTHAEIKPYSCMVCSKGFLREAPLRKHEESHDGVPKYECNLCDKAFLCPEILKMHKEKHNRSKKFICSLCKKSFVFKQGLENHMKIHFQEKTHKCNYCDSSFNSAIQLTRHMTTHDVLRPYPCKICGRNFLLSHHLTRHMRTHFATEQGQEPEDVVGQYKCDICSMSFKRVLSLVNHSAIHSMVNLVCVICNTSFDTAQMVKDHITSHLQDLPFRCNNCCYTFDTEDQLDEHKLKHAEMEYEEQIEKEFLSEAKKQQLNPAEEGGNESYEDAEFNEPAEFTITDVSAPEVQLKRTKEPNQNKQKRLKTELSDDGGSLFEIEDDEAIGGQKNNNIVPFFKSEVESDAEDEPANEEQEEMEESREPLRPIVRSEGTKVYCGKSPIERKLPPSVEEVRVSSLAHNADRLRIDSFQINSLSGTVEKRGAKFGDRVIKVQKFIMKKDEMKQLAKQGVLEVKNGQVVLKDHGMPILNATLKSVEKDDIDNLIKQTPRAKIRQYSWKPQEKMSQDGGIEEIDLVDGLE